MRKPVNILFLQTDQQRHDALGCVNPLFKTPNLDALAARGVRFTQAVCNVPMCVASRYSMMTGLYGFQCGVKHNTQMIACDEDLPVPVLAQRLAAAGYQTAGFGKTHWYIGSKILPETPVKGSCRGFDTRYIRGAGADPNKRETSAIYMSDDEPGNTKEDEQERQFGPGGETVAGYIGKTTEIAPENLHEGWLARKGLDFLDSRRNSDQPFFMYLSLDYPHVGLAAPRKYEEMYKIEDFQEESLLECLPEHHHHCERYKDIWPAMNSEERRRSRLRYAALCTYVDDLFGQVIQRLEDTGELENTLILFTSDHGDMIGDHGRVSKYCLYEGSVRVPMILAGPGVNGQGRQDSRPAELVDVVPTFLDATGMDIPEILPGFSLLSDFSRSGSFCERHGRGYEEYQRAPAVMWRTEEWKLIIALPGRLGDIQGRYDKIEGELYHLATDPKERNNRYADPECAAIREQMTAQVLMHIMSSLGRYPSGASRARVRITGPETQPDSSVWNKPSQ